MLLDKDIREPLFEYLEEQYDKVRILEEKTMGRSRADVVMVLEEEVVGVEIKSDADTYARLSRQVKDYDRFFDRNLVVVGTSHAHHVAEHIPDYWGIITVEEQGKTATFICCGRHWKIRRKKCFTRSVFSGGRSWPISRKSTACRRISRKARILCKRRYWRKSRKKCCKSRSVMNCSRGIIRPYRRR